MHAFILLAGVLGEARANPWCVKPERECVTVSESSVAGSGGVSVAQLGSIGGGGSNATSTTRDCQQLSQKVYECLLEQYTLCLASSTKEAWFEISQKRACSSHAVAPSTKKECLVGQTISRATMNVWSKSDTLDVLWIEKSGIVVLKDDASRGRNAILVDSKGGMVSVDRTSDAFESTVAGYRGQVRCVKAAPEEDELGDLVCQFSGTDLVIGISRYGSEARIETAKRMCR